jgi:hypothetical protein
MPERRPRSVSPSRGEADDRPGAAPRLLIAVSLASLLAAALVLIGVLDPADENALPAELSHVHGLGVNPADGKLYIATHDGVFVLNEAGGLERVGEGRQDTMGFTVAGRNHFLASGHPAPGEEGPTSLGLIESTDGGTGWKSLSLSGRADFHALRFAHGSEFGLDSHSGELLVSADLVNWEARSSQPLFDIAVNPSDPEFIIGTGPEGLVRSLDGGRTWEPVRAEPMVLLHWSNNGLLRGIGPNGEVYVNFDQGATWEPAVESVEAVPSAFTAAGDELFIATDDARILSSDDWGWSWEEIYSPDS